MRTRIGIAIATTALVAAGAVGEISCDPGDPSATICDLTVLPDPDGLWTYSGADQRVTRWEEGAPVASVVVPGLAFDPRGFRVGYAGGFYDRLLADPNIQSQGMGFTVVSHGWLEKDDWYQDLALALRAHTGLRLEASHLVA